MILRKLTESCELKSIFIQIKSRTACLKTNRQTNKQANKKASSWGTISRFFSLMTAPE